MDKIISFTLVLLAVIASAAAQAEPRCSLWRSNCWEDGKDFIGTIGHEYGVQMRLVRKDRHLSGYYFFESKARYIRLKGKVKPDSSFVLKEYTEGKRTGKFTGKLTEDRITGLWSRKGGEEELPFMLKEYRRSLRSYNGQYVCQAQYPYHKGDLKLKIVNGGITGFETKTISTKKSRACNIKIGQLKRLKGRDVIGLRVKQSKCKITINDAGDYLKVSYNNKCNKRPQCGRKGYFTDWLIHKKSRSCETLW